MAQDGPPERAQASPPPLAAPPKDGGDPPAGTAAARRPTLKTIAQATGLAVPTVSRALGDAPDLSTETKARVRRVAAEMGYVPDRAGLRLRTGRTNVVALVLPTEDGVMNHTARLISSLAAALRGTQLHLNVTPVSPAEDPLGPVRLLVERGLADAVVLNQTRPRDARVAWLMERGFPFATHGRTVWAADHAWFDFDNEAWARIGLRRLAARGRRLIAVLAPPVEQNYALDVLRGARAGAPPGVEVLVIEGATSDDPHPVMRAAVERALGQGADGVVAASPTAAMAAVAAIEARGLRLGREADVFAKEAIPFLSLFRPGILAVREDVGRAGEVLGRAVLRVLREPGRPPLQELEVPRDEDVAEPVPGPFPETAEPLEASKGPA